MKHSIRTFLAVAAAILCISPALSAHASTSAPVRSRNIAIQGVADATAASTFNTTSYADLPAATVSVTPYRDYTSAALEAPGTPSITDYLLVSWTADVTKATTTTGTCAVYINGAIQANTARTVDVAAKQNSIGGSFLIANTTLGTQTVKLQCKSGDTAVFTVNNAQLTVIEVL